MMVCGNATKNTEGGQLIESFKDIQFSVLDRIDPI